MKDIPVMSLHELVEAGVVQLTRGKVISRKDIAACPGIFPIYSSAKDNDGKFGEYGKFLFDEELITWSVDGGGRLFHRPKHKFSVTNVGGILRLRDKKVLDYRYLYHALSLRHSEIRFDWVRKAHPSVIQKLYRNIPVPPLAEQRRIAATLDEATEGIATAKSNIEKNRANARAIFESKLQSVFAKRGEGWVEKAIGEMCEIKHGFAFDGADFSSEVPAGCPLVVTPGNFTENGRLVFSTKNSKRFQGRAPTGFKFDVGDLVVVMTDLSSKMKILGKPAFIESPGVLHNQRIGRVVFLNEEIEKRLLYYFMMTEGFLRHIKSSATGTMVKHTAPKRILSNVMAFPKSHKQQIVIIQTLDGIREKTERLDQIYQRKVASLEALKESLLHRAFAGELTVSTTSELVEAEA